MAALALVSLIASGTACDDDTGSGGEGGEGGSGGDGGSAGGDGGGGAGGDDGGGGSGGGEPTIVLYGSIFEFPSNQPIEDGDVCFLAEGVELCTELGVQGAYFIDDLPISTQGGFRIRAPTLPTSYLMFKTQAEGDGEVHFILPSHASLDSLYEAAQLTRTPTSAAVFIAGTSQALPVLTPTSGEGPYYLTGSGELDLEAMATVDIGVGLFLDVDRAAGPFTAHLEVEGVVCDFNFYGAKVSEPWDLPDDAAQVFVHARCPEPGEEGDLP
ncbi:MAG: hypothetical protein IPG04_25120 [Polyangiaceae bacterium]|nr:hypothetical protein [Polyangiaceae bacterium]